MLFPGEQIFNANSIVLRDGGGGEREREREKERKILTSFKTKFGP